MLTLKASALRSNPNLARRVRLVSRNGYWLTVESGNNLWLVRRESVRSGLTY